MFYNQPSAAGYSTPDALKSVHAEINANVVGGIFSRPHENIFYRNIVDTSHKATEAAFDVGSRISFLSLGTTTPVKPYHTNMVMLADEFDMATKSFTICGSYYKNLKIDKDVLYMIQNIEKDWSVGIIDTLKMQMAEEYHRNFQRLVLADLMTGIAKENKGEAVKLGTVANPVKMEIGIIDQFLFHMTKILKDRGTYGLSSTAKTGDTANMSQMYFLIPTALEPLLRSFTTTRVDINSVQDDPRLKVIGFKELFGVQIIWYTDKDIPPIKNQNGTYTYPIYLGNRDAYKHVSRVVTAEFHSSSNQNNNEMNIIKTRVVGGGFLLSPDSCALAYVSIEPNKYDYRPAFSVV